MEKDSWVDVPVATIDVGDFIIVETPRHKRPVVGEVLEVYHLDFVYFLVETYNCRVNSLGYDPFETIKKEVL